MTAQELEAGLRAAFPKFSVDFHADMVRVHILYGMDCSFYVRQPEGVWYQHHGNSTPDLPAAIAAVEAERQKRIAALLLDGETLTVADAPVKDKP